MTTDSTPYSNKNIHNNINENPNSKAFLGKDLGVEHTPFDASLWSGRHEPDETERACYWYQIVQPYLVNNDKTKLSLVGFACDQGVRRNLGRVGAKKAPPAIRQAFAKLPLSAQLQDRFSNDDLSNLLSDVGDFVCHDANTLTPDVLEQTQAAYSEQLTELIKQGHLTFGLGGGHAMAYASYLGLWNALNDHSNSASSNASNNNTLNNGPRIGIINFDAHLDIRNATNGTSGTPFRQIAEHNKKYGQPFNYCAIGISQFSNTAALFDRAQELGVRIISDDDSFRLPWSSVEQQLNDFIDSVDVVYLTIDMDGFATSIVPGVSAPSAKGMTVDFVERCIETIFARGKVKMADIAEINPTYDIDGRSCKVAARLLALMIEQYLLLS